MANCTDLIASAPVPSPSESPRRSVPLLESVLITSGLSPQFCRQRPGSTVLIHRLLMLVSSTIWPGQSTKWSGNPATRIDLPLQAPTSALVIAIVQPCGKSDAPGTVAS